MRDQSIECLRGGRDQRSKGTQKEGARPWVSPTGLVEPEIPTSGWGASREERREEREERQGGTPVNSPERGVRTGGERVVVHPRVARLLMP